MTEETIEQLQTFADSETYEAVIELLDTIVKKQADVVLALGDTPENQPELATQKSRYTGAVKLKEEFERFLRPRKGSGGVVIRQKKKS